MPENATQEEIRRAYRAAAEARAPRRLRAAGRGGAHAVAQRRLPRARRREEPRRVRPRPHPAAGLGRRAQPLGSVGPGAAAPSSPAGRAPARGAAPARRRGSRRSPSSSCTRSASAATCRARWRPRRRSTSRSTRRRRPRPRRPAACARSRPTPRAARCGRTSTTTWRVPSRRCAAPCCWPASGPRATRSAGGRCGGWRRWWRLGGGVRRARGARRHAGGRPRVGAAVARRRGRAVARLAAPQPPLRGLRRHGPDAARGAGAGRAGVTRRCSAPTSCTSAWRPSARRSSPLPETRRRTAAATRSRCPRAGRAGRSSRGSAGSAVPVARIWCQAPGGIAMASPASTSAASPSTSITPRAVEDEVDLLAVAVVVALGLPAGRQRGLGQALVRGWAGARR